MTAKVVEDSDIPTKVFEAFIEKLSETKIPEDVVQRLRTTLLEKKKFSDSALTAALFTSSPPNHGPH